MRHVAGTSVGIGTMAVAVAAGLGVLVATVPQVALVLKIIGSAYLLYLAYQVAGTRAVQPSEALQQSVAVLQQRPAVAYQYVNPKDLVFVLAAFTAVARPLRLWQAAAFQYVNPKAWVFVLAAFTAFRPAGLPVVVATGLMVLTRMIVVFPSALLWAAGGSLLGRFINRPRARRILSAVLAALLAATVVYIWI